MTTPQTDTNVKIPAAVKAAAARSNQIHATAYATEPPAAPEPVVDAAAPPAAPPVAPPPPVEPPPAPPVDWEHRYNSMKGRFERAEARSAQLQDQITSLLARLDARPPTPQPAPQVQPLLTPQEVEEYGEDLLKVVGKRAKEELNPLLSKFEGDLASVKDQLANVGSHLQQSARDRMLSDMDRSLPDWRELNTNSEFLDWLALPDAFSGVIRHELLKAAFEQNNSPRVLAFFNGFLQEAAVAPSDGQDQTAQPPVPPAAPQPHKISLETLAAPGRAKTAAPSAPAEKPSFTRAQIQAFYHDVSRGAYRGRDADKAKVEAQIFEATREGRVL
jgi:hypothetical protein